MTGSIVSLRLTRNTAHFEDVDYPHAQALDKSTMMALSSLKWIWEYHSVLIEGTTGVGKTYIACALAYKACL